MNDKRQFKAARSFADFYCTLLNKENGIHAGKLVANFEEAIRPLGEASSKLKNGHLIIRE